MQESARAALSHLRARATDLGISVEFLAKHDLHAHVPAGAIPKDGPSAGVTTATAILSAARRFSIKTWILPALNEPDLEDLPEELRRGMTFVPVDTLDQVVKVAMTEGVPAH